MPKLHELLAVRDQQKGQAAKVIGDLKTTFEKKHHLFGESRTTYTPDAEGAEPRVESQSSLQSTVYDELKWLAGIWAKALDHALKVEDVNTTARADILHENGQTFLAGVPGLALLELERRVQEIQDLVMQIPTLDPAKGFEPDSSRKAGIYKARDVQKTRTEKVMEAVVLIQPTKEHPGQAQMVPRDKRVGMLQTQEWSGMITPKAKAAMLERCEEMARGIKAARSRANDVEVKSELKIGAALLAYIFGTPESGEVQAQG